MHLNAGAIELEFERRLAQIGKGGFDAIRGFRQHGLNRTEKLDAAAVEPGGAGFPQQARHSGEKILFGAGGARHQGIQRVAFAPLGAGAFDGRDLLDGALHFTDFEGSDFRRGRGRFAQRGEPDSGASAQ